MTAVKHEWHKCEKELYCPKQQAVQIAVPSMKFLVLDGVGNPNHAAFADDIEALYSLSYGRCCRKKGVRRMDTLITRCIRWRRFGSRSSIRSSLIRIICNIG